MYSYLFLSLYYNYLTPYLSPANPLLGPGAPEPPPSPPCPESVVRLPLHFFFSPVASSAIPPSPLPQARALLFSHYIHGTFPHQCYLFNPSFPPTAFTGSSPYDRGARPFLPVVSPFPGGGGSVSTRTVDCSYI